MNVALDFDGVVYPWHYSVHKYFTEFRGYSGNEFDFWNNEWKSFPKEYQEYYIKLPILYQDILIESRVMESIRKLSNEHTIYYITGRDKSLERITRNYFDKCELPFRENIIFDSNKNVQLRFHNIGFFLDDFPEIVKNASGITNAVLFNREHNRNGREGLNCVSSISQFHSYIRHQTGADRISVLKKELGYD